MVAVYRTGMCKPGQRHATELESLTLQISTCPGLYRTVLLRHSIATASSTSWLCSTHGQHQLSCTPMVKIYRDLTIFVAVHGACLLLTAFYAAATGNVMIFWFTVPGCRKLAKGEHRLERRG